MEKFLNVVRSNNMVQAVLCIAFGLFLMIYPSITCLLYTSPSPRDCS